MENKNYGTEGSILGILLGILGTIILGVGGYFIGSFFDKK